MISLYWDIGCLIVERQRDAGWGKSVVETLANDLQAEFPGIGGLSARNIWRMRNFYLTYHDNEKLPPLVAEIGWSHNLIIIEKCKDDLEREFYLRMTRKLGWTKNVLTHQIENKTYEKTMLGQTNFEETLPEEIRGQAKLAVKDEYTFDFLELGRIEPFLREMGGVFSFIGSQYRLEVGDQEYFVDLLLHHRRLRCLVAIELKIGEFLPEYVGKMQFYPSIVALGAVHAGVKLGNVHVFDYYRGALRMIVEEGLLSFLHRTSTTYLTRAGSHFDPRASSHSERLLRRWADRRPPVERKTTPQTEASDEENAVRE